MDGVYIGGRKGRQQRALDRLKESIKKVEAEIKKNGISKKGPDNPESAKLLKSLERMHNEELILEDRLSGKKKQNTVKNKETGEVTPKLRYFVDIYSIHLGYVKNSDRRKNKGKSRKKMRKVKNTTFVRSVVFQPGMVESFREGRMGVSPKTHTFRVRREEPTIV